MELKYRYELDVVSSGAPVVVHVSQYSDDFTLQFDMYASTGQLTIPESSLVQIRGTKKDGNGYSASGTVVINSDYVVTATFAGDKQMTAVAGQNDFEVVFSYNGKDLYSTNFILDVEKTALDKGTITSESAIKEIKSAEKFYNMAKENAESAEASKNASASWATDASTSAASAKASAETAKSFGEDLKDRIDSVGFTEDPVTVTATYGGVTASCDFIKISGTNLVFARFSVSNATPTDVKTGLTNFIPSQFRPKKLMHSSVNVTTSGAKMAGAGKLLYNTDGSLTIYVPTANVVSNINDLFLYYL